MNFYADEDTLFKVKKSLNCGGRVLDLSTPAIMGIINLTPDSFYDGGTLRNEKEVLSRTELMLKDGADIIDIGGQSTRPNSKRIDATEESKRIMSSLKAIVKSFPEAIVSVDTFYSDVASVAIEEGASIINDISGGKFDNKMYDVIKQKQVPYIVMHIQGTPENMQQDPSYDHVVKDVLKYFIEKITTLQEAGIHDIIVDPGFGFGKTVEHNYELLSHLNLFRIFDCPIMVGLSRKSMITRVLNVKPEDALTGTIALNTIALLKGVSILRVHDVAEAAAVRKIINTYLRSSLLRK